MKRHWMIIFLVIIWGGFSNSFALLNLLLGLLIALLCVCLFKSTHPSYYKINSWAILSLLGITLIELIKSSCLVAWDVLTPRHKSQPKILSLKLACEYDIERALLAGIISLTPGTLSIDLSNDKTTLTIHAMFANEPEKILAYIQDYLEPKVMRVFCHGPTKS